MVLFPDLKKQHQVPDLPTKLSGTGSAKVRATYPLESVRPRARVFPREAGAQSSAACTLLQQSNLRAWASEPHVLEAAAGESTHQVPCVGCLLTESLFAECLLYTQQ